MGFPKQLADLQGRPMLRCTLDNMLRSEAESIILVLGAGSGQIRESLNLDRAASACVAQDASDALLENSLSSGRLQIVYNDHWQSGLASSLKAGLKACPRDTRAVMVALGDMPFVTTEVVDDLLHEFLESGQGLVAPAYQGRRGHPVLLDRRYFGELEQLQGDKGAAGILRRHQQEVVLRPTDCQGVIYDVDTPEDIPEAGAIAGIGGAAALRSALRLALRSALIVVRGGGDLGSGVAFRLFKAGFPVLITELEHPRMVRGTVCYGSAVDSPAGEYVIEGVRSRYLGSLAEPGWEDTVRRAVTWACAGSCIPVVSSVTELHLLYLRQWLQGSKLFLAAVADCRMLKRTLPDQRHLAPVTVGLGPGFVAGGNVTYAVETMRGLTMGKVLTSGQTMPDTGVPGVVGGESWKRLLRAPCPGRFRPAQGIAIGVPVKEKQLLGWVGDQPVMAMLDGMLRGLVAEGVCLEENEKLGDIDPRPNVDVNTISDKARALGGSVLEAVLGGLVRL